MDWVETTGKSVEDAKEAALELLGVDATDAEFDIVEDARTGIFGRVKSEARVRARVRPTTPRPKLDRRDRRRGGRSSKPDQLEGDGATRESSRSNGGADSKGSSRIAQAKSASQGAAAANDGHRDRKSSSRDRSARDGSGRPGRTDTRTLEKETSVESRDDMPVDEQAAHAEEFLTGLLAELGIAAELTRETIEIDIREVQIAGAGVGLLVGPRGRTLDALQDVVRTVVQKHAGASDKRVRVDVGGYRVRRREALVTFARQCAAEVLSSGVARALEPMTSPDRKTVHDALVDLEGVVTTSEGEEPRRRVVISPAG